MVQLDFAGVCADHQVSTNPHNWRDNEGFIGIFTEDLQVAVDFVRNNNNNNNNNNIDPRVIGKRLRWFAIFLFRAPSPRQPPFEMHGMRSEKPVELQQQPHPALQQSFCFVHRRQRFTLEHERTPAAIATLFASFKPSTSAPPLMRSNGAGMWPSKPSTSASPR